MFKKGFTLIELLIVVAIIAILAAIAVPNFLEAQVRSKVSRVKADIRSLATAVESYYVDNNSYPAVDSSDPTNRLAGGLGSGWGINDIEGASQALLVLPTFRGRGDGFLMTLTTPIAYITSYFPDPFASTKGAFYLYCTVQNNPSIWFAWSYGPDTDEKEGSDFGPHLIGPTFVRANPGRNPITGAQDPLIAETLYGPADQNSESLRNITYDPTNGSTSSGDVWRVKQ